MTKRTAIPNIAYQARLRRTKTDHTTTVRFFDKAGKMLYSLIAFPNAELQPIPISADAVSVEIEGDPSDSIFFDTVT